MWISIVDCRVAELINQKPFTPLAAATIRALEFLIAGSLAV